MSPRNILVPVEDTDTSVEVLVRPLRASPFVACS